MSTSFQRLKAALDDPIVRMCRDHGGHEMPIPVGREILTQLVAVVDDVLPKWDNIHTHYGYTDTCAACNAVADLLPQQFPKED